MFYSSHFHRKILNMKFNILYSMFKIFNRKTEIIAKISIFICDYILYIEGEDNKEVLFFNWHYPYSNKCVRNCKKKRERYAKLFPKEIYGVANW